MSLVIRREIDVEVRIAELLKKFVGKKFNGVTISEVVRQYDRGLEGRRVDLAVLKDDGAPLLLVETKKKYEVRGYKVVRRFIVTSEEVLGQVFSYAAILKKNGVYVPFVATANDRQIAVFMIPEDIDRHVNWEAVKTREYARVLHNDYVYGVLRPQYLLFHRQIRLTEDFFAEILEALTGIYVKKYGIEEKKQELHWVLIEDLRSFVDFLTPFIQEAIAPGGRYREEIDKLVEDYAKTRGYRPTPEQLAREMTYVLLNKIVFYKVLERHYKLEPLKPLYREGIVKSVSEYLEKLNELISKAVEVTGNFEPVFKTGIYDHIDIVESEEVLKVFDWLIELIDVYRIEKFGEIIGYVYEDLIPAEERHRLGQFYTPKPIAELIVKWCIRSPDDRVLDPGCGSGTFLIEAYKRLAELKLKRGFSEIRFVPRDVHEQSLSQLVGVDINEFPVHLTTMNLAVRNPKAPSTKLNVVLEDYFNIRPGYKRLKPYRVKGVEGERLAEVSFKDFDAVVGNPPYTRWTEIPKPTQDRILELYRDTVSKYGLTPQVARGVEPGIYVYWIMHSTGFLKDGGRLGMIISDSWLQTDYGVSFFRYLLDHYKIHAVIDISARVFPVPLVGACIVLLEKCSNRDERLSNKVVFMYLDISRGDLEVDKVLELLDKARGSNVESLEHAFPSGAKALVRVYKQGDLLKYEDRLINLVFRADDAINMLRKHPLITSLATYFEPSRGNTMYSYLASKGDIRGTKDVGGNEFFYLSEERARELGIPKEYLHPLLPSPRYLRFFTFTQDDWDEIRRDGGECYLFLCRKRRGELPDPVRRYIGLGEGPNAQIRLRRRRGENVDRPVSESQAAKTRLRYRDLFFDWYDLGGVISTPIIASYYAQYWHRFALAKFEVACDADIIALIPKRNTLLDEEEMKALLAYLNSSFDKLYIESKGRTTGGGALAIEVNILRDMPVLDIKKLPRETIERLAQLFDKLEAEARRLGGADRAENVFGTELAKELVGREVEQGVDGLFNTVIKEVDHEVARALGLEELVEIVRALTISMARRRLSRAGEARPSALRGSEPVAPKPARLWKSKRANSKPPTVRLDKWFKPK